MRRIAQHGLVFTEFEDPGGERWVEVLREADREPVGYEQNEARLDLDEAAENWIRSQLGASPPRKRRCERCRFVVWTHGERRGKPGDEAVEIDATIEIGGGVIRFVNTVLCRDCAEGVLAEAPWLTATFGDEL